MLPQKKKRAVVGISLANCVILLETFFLHNKQITEFFEGILCLLGE